MDCLCRVLAKLGPYHDEICYAVVHMDRCYILIGQFDLHTTCCSYNNTYSFMYDNKCMTHPPTRRDKQSSPIIRGSFLTESVQASGFYVIALPLLVNTLGILSSLLLLLDKLQDVC